MLRSRYTRIAAAVLLVLTVAFFASRSLDGQTELQVPPTAPSLDISSFGAVGDGRTDDSAALNRAFTEAPAHSTIALEPGRTYAHDEVLTVTVEGLTIQGPGTLYATDPGRSTLDIRADRVSVLDVDLEFDTRDAVRLNTLESTMILLNKSTGAHIRDVSINGSPSAGVLALGASDFLLEGVTAQNTLADSFHSTYGTHDGVFNNCTSVGSGDDGFANVSYLTDPGPVHNMTYNNDTVRDQQWGRGFSVVGGRDITFTNITGDGTAGAAVYISAESEYRTAGAENIHVRTATLNRSNTRPSVDQGAVLIYSSQPQFGISDVDMSDVRITNTRIDATRNVGIQAGSGLGVTRVGLYRFSVTGPVIPLTFEGAPLSFNQHGWIVNGDPISGRTGFAE